MFILEESQLLEDTIQDKGVLELYKALRKNEFNGDRKPLLEILSEERCYKAVEFIAEYLKLNGDDLKLTPELKESFFSSLNVEKNDGAALLLIVSATLNQLFMIDNYTGPSYCNGEICFELPEIYTSLRDLYDYRSLALDGHEVYHRIVNPWLLKTVQTCWTLLGNLGVSRRLLDLEFLVWKHRYLTIHLALLLDPPEAILKELNKIHEYIFDHHVINEVKDNKTQLTRYNIVALCCELIQSALLRNNITSCRKMFDYASEISGVSIEHTGVLGKRTRFQHNDIPQLVIRVSNSNVADINAIEKCEISRYLPKDIMLDDDTLLPDIKFVKESDNDGDSTCTEQDLSPEAQLLMLTRLDYILKTEVMEESLKDEWTLAYVRSIINSATIWGVKYKALGVRSFCERKSMRKMDRSLLQLEELIKEVDNTKLEPDVRMQMFYSSMPLSKWQMQRLLGDISFDLCLFKNALEIYSRLEYWEGIIKCYAGLDETVKAEKIIRQELTKQETPYLYCLLGDVTEDIHYYEKSWQLSKERYSRAKKSIGTYYYTRKNYEEAINNYEQALKASPSNISILSLLAYCCLILGRYERAAECYRNLTYQDDGNFLAWNNLSKAYIKLNQKERAWRTLREAIKCNFEEWKVWENFMIVAVEIGALDDVIIAWHRLIDIKNSHQDDQILSALTFCIIKRSYVKADSEFMKLLADALKLLGRISTTGACSSRAWICYFRLLAREYDLLIRDGKTLTKYDVDTRMLKIVNTLQRATPNTMALDANWFMSPEKVDQVLGNYDELIDCYLLAINLFKARGEILTQWKYFKLSITNTLKTLRQKGGYIT